MGLGQAVNSLFLGRQSLRFAFEITPRLAGMAVQKAFCGALAPPAVLSFPTLTFSFPSRNAQVTCHLV